MKLAMHIVMMRVMRAMMVMLTWCMSVHIMAKGCGVASHPGTNPDVVAELQLRQRIWKVSSSIENLGRTRARNGKSRCQDVKDKFFERCSSGSLVRSKSSAGSEL